MIIVIAASFQSGSRHLELVTLFLICKAFTNVWHHQQAVGLLAGGKLPTVRLSTAGCTLSLSTY